MTRFEIPGAPVSKQRPRFGKGNTYTARETRAYETKVKLCAYTARVPKSLGPVAITLAFFLPDRRRRDLDNLAKSVTDALNGVAYIDDSLIHEAHLIKHFDKERPRCVVTIMPMGGA